MGMFDDIIGHEEPCPRCGATVKGWQSKSGPCELRELHFSMVWNFYTNCDKCGLWIEYDRVSPGMMIDCYQRSFPFDKDFEASQPGQ
jgi:hypothetical protein